VKKRSNLAPSKREDASVVIAREDNQHLEASQAMAVVSGVRLSGSPRLPVNGPIAIELHRRSAWGDTKSHLVGREIWGMSAKYFACLRVITNSLYESEYGLPAA
jgi:hypothetical protein